MSSVDIALWSRINQTYIFIPQCTPNDIFVFPLVISMNRLVTVSFLFISTLTFGQSGGTWTKKADVSTMNRESGVGFALNAKSYIGLGIVSGGVNGALWEYDHTTDVWTQKASMLGGGRVNAVAFGIAGNAYVGTGEDNMFNLDKRFYQYNPALNQWTAKADFGGTARTEAVGFAIGSKGYVGTGYDGTRKKDFWEYDPTANTWTQKADFGGTARRRAVGFSVDGKGYIGTGNDGSLKKDFWEYDPATNTWTQKKDFGGAARESAVGFALNHNGYIGTGDSGTGKNDIWEYNPGTDEWLRRADFPGQRRYVAVGFANTVYSKAYIGTGFTDEPSIGVSTKDFYEFTPPQPPQAPANAMVTAYTANSIRLHWFDKSYNETGFIIERSTDGINFSETATVAPNTVTYTDNGLATGQKYYYRVRAAHTTEGVSASSNIVSQITGAALNGIWTTTVKANDANSNPSFDFGVSTFTIDGIIYLTGSMALGSSVSDDTKKLWAYDPTTRAFTQKASFAGSARTQSVGFALNDKGYIATGTASGAANALNDLWQYDPTTNQWEQKADVGTTGRLNAFVFTLNNKAYVGGGTLSTTSLAGRDFYEYDPTSDTWTQKADFPENVNGAPAIGYHGKGYAIHPYQSSIFFEYDPTADTWTDIGNFALASYGYKELAVIKDRFFAVTYDFGSPARSGLWEWEMENGRWIERALHASGSQYGNAAIAYTDDRIFQFYQKAVYEYDPDHELRAPEDIVAEIVDPAKVNLTWSLDANAEATQIYRAENEAGPYTLVAEVPGNKTSYLDAFTVGDKTVFYKLRATKGTFESAYTEPVPTSRRGAWRFISKIKDNGNGLFGDIATATSTRGYLGITSSHKTWWEYNPESDTWTQKANFPGDLRSNGSSFVINDQIYVGFGSIYDENSSKSKALKDLYQFDPGANTWTKKGDFSGQARFYSSVTSGNGKGYVIGGDADNGADSFLTDIWEYTPASDSWSKIADLPVGSAFVSSFVKDNKLWIINGSQRFSSTSYGSVSQFRVLDLASGTWTKIENSPPYAASGPVALINDDVYFSTLGMVAYNFNSQKFIYKEPIPFTVSSVRSFAIAGRIYGLTSNYELWTYNPNAAVSTPENLTSEFSGDRITLRWENTSSLPVRTEIQYINTQYQSYQTYGVTSPGATEFIATGLTNDLNYRFRVVSIVETGERSQPSNVTMENTGPFWTRLPKVPMATRTGPVSFTSNGKFYYGTGSIANAYLKDIWEYDIATGTWTQKADFPGEERAGATTFTLGDDVYVGFGSTQLYGALKDLYKYSSTSNTWSAAGTYPNDNAIQGPGVFVDNGFAYLIGGTRNGSNNTINELWRFDGANWTQLTSLPGETRKDPIAFVLDGKAYVGGGVRYSSGSSSYAGKQFWSYTIATDTWEQIADLPDNVLSWNRSYSATTSNSVMVFIASSGGVAGNGLQAHIYTPSTGKWSTPGRPLTLDFLFNNFAAAQDPATGLNYFMISQSEGLKMWRYDYQPDGPNLIEVKLMSGGLASLKWRRITPQPDSVVIFRSNTYNVLGTRQGVVTSADTTGFNSVTPGNTYYYSIRAYRNAGQFKTSAQRMLVVENIPGAPIALEGELIDGNIHLNWQPGEGAPATAYTVERALGGSSTFTQIGTSQAPSFISTEIVAATMSYRVKASNATGSSDYSNVVTIIVTGVEEETTVGVYPNPASDYITIDVAPQDGVVRMQLLDYHGRAMMERDIRSTSRVDISSYSPGVYFVNLVSTKRATNKYIKIIKK